MRCCGGPRTLRWSGCVFLQSIAICAAFSGCGAGEDEAPSAEAMLAIENVAKWYQLYRAKNAGKPPSDEDALVAFVDATLAERGDAAVDRGELLTSPRDNERYVIRFGELAEKNQERKVVVYESKGIGGTKLIATEFGGSRLVDEAELQTILAGD